MVAQGLCMGLQMHVCMGQACLAGPLGTQAHTPSMMPAAWGQVGCGGEVRCPHCALTAAPQTLTQKSIV